MRRKIRDPKNPPKSSRWGDTVIERWHYRLDAGETIDEINESDVMPTEKGGPIPSDAIERAELTADVEAAIRRRNHKDDLPPWLAKLNNSLRPATTPVKREPDKPAPPPTADEVAEMVKQAQSDNRTLSKLWRTRLRSGVEKGVIPAESVPADLLIDDPAAPKHRPTA